jgi:5'-nucleotidase
MKNCPPDLVLSGVNNGYNLCEDTTYSGTIGAAIEATIAGIPAIAFSQETSEQGKIDCKLAEELIKKIINKLINFNWPEATLFNVNFPYRYNPKFNIKITKQGRMKLGDDIIVQNQTRDKVVYKIGKMHQSGMFDSETDIAAMRSGDVSITPLTIDLTNHKELDNLKTLFES